MADLTNMDEYLSSSEYINWNHSGVLAKAESLVEGIGDAAGKIQSCFTFVRDEIRHSADYSLNPVTCRASDVLKHGTGFCYAKSHLLAALLRANGVATGFCYQRLRVNDDQPRLSLHGLNAVYLPETGWFRIDARGNKPGVDAQFTPPVERLAFPVVAPGEADLPEIWPEPLPVIIWLLSTCTTFQQVINALPDVELIQ